MLLAGERVALNNVLNRGVAAAGSDCLESAGAARAVARPWRAKAPRRGG